MASYGRNTDDGEVQRSKELIGMGRRTRKAQCTLLYVRDSNEEKRSQKALIDPGCTSLLDSEDLKVMSTNRDDNAMDYFSTLTFRDCSRKFLLLLLPLG
jgi:hypothetical protein